MKQAAALRELLAACKGYPSWIGTPEPLRGLIELAAEVRVFRRMLVKGLWEGSEPPTRWQSVAELERRMLLALGVDAASLPDAPSLETIRERYAQEKS